MFSSVLSNLNLVSFVVPGAFIVSVFFAMFLFWRAGRRELYDSELLFELIIICSVGAIFFGRVSDFLLTILNTSPSISRFIFFNVYGGFEFYGAIVGAILAGAFFMYQKKDNFWHLLDLSVAPIAYGRSLFLLGEFAKLGLSRKFNSEFYLHGFSFVGFFTIFWILKRLEAKKRHVGFFSSVFALSVSLLGISLYQYYPEETRIYSSVSSYIPFFIILFLIGGIFWYFLARRKLSKDLKAFFAFLLLSIFKLKRVLTTIGEADRTARAIILSPYYLVKLALYCVKLVLREIAMGFIEFAHALGIKNK